MFRDRWPTFQSQIHENGARVLRTRFQENRSAELAEIYTTRSLGCFLELISFPSRSVTFDLLSKAKYTKLGLISCVRGSVKIAGRNWPKLTPRALWAVFLGLISFSARSVPFDLLFKVKYTKMVGQNTWMSIYQALITVFHFCKDQHIVGLEGQALSIGNKACVIITMELRRF